MADEEATIDTSLRDALQDAVEKDQQESEEETPAEAAPETEVPEQAADVDVLEDLSESDDTPEKVEATPDEPQKAKNQPPLGWSPDLKDKWKDLDPDFQEAIASRERETNQVIENTKESRRIAEGFVRTIEPYRALMAAEGIQDPLQAINGLMQVTATLQTGTPQQKAMRIAGLIEHYGIDIPTLDQVLAGQQPQEAPQQVSDPRIDHIWNTMQQAQYTKQQETDAQAYQSISGFSQDHPYLQDPAFRNEMADWLERAGANGQHMTLEQAHDKAVAALPQYAAHAAKARAAAQSRTVGDKQNAGSSISGQRGGNLGPAKSEGNTDIRSLLESQMSTEQRI